MKEELKNEKGKKTDKRKNVLRNLLMSLQSLDRKLSKMLLNINPADAITVAGIHATIFSIIMGFISAYALYVYSKNHEAEIQVLQEASKINTIQLNGAYSIGLEDEFDTSDLTKREDILKRLHMLGTGQSGYHQPITTTKTERLWKPLPTTPEERGHESLKALNAVFAHYPFATGAFNFGGMQKVKPINFNNVEDVKKWADDLDKTSGTITWQLRTFTQTYQDNFDAFGRTPNIGYQFNVNNYFQVALAAQELLRSVRSQLAQIEARKPNKNSLIAGLIISFIGLFCGVIIPMLYKDSNPIIFLLIPFFCYFCIFFYLIYFIAEK
jgi:hypothetical protein